MVKPPPVTVVVPHFGAPGLSMPLLEALLRQQGCPELQVVSSTTTHPTPSRITPV